MWRIKMPKSNKEQRIKYWQDRIDEIKVKERQLETEYKVFKTKIKNELESFKDAIKNIEEE